MMKPDAALEQRILIYAPLGKDAQLAVKVLGSVALTASVCHGIDVLLSELDKGAGLVLIIEEALAGDGLGRLQQYVAVQPTWSDLPILLLTRHGVESAGLQQACDVLGNVTLLERPIRTATLISTVRSALRARAHQYQVREADRRKDEFLASLSHELRNPLAPIRTAMLVLKRMYPASIGVTQIREVVERQVSYLTRLVDDLLDVARITSGKVVLQRETVALSTVVAHAVEVCNPLMEAGGHVLSVSQPAQEVYLDIDLVRVVQSVTNVLANAAKYTILPGKISFDATVENNWLIITVRDNGIGMEPESLSRIFDMFAQNLTFPNQTPGGLGIGLSLARQFAEMHGGSIGAHSDGPGTGSQFVLRLPVVIQPVAQGVAGPADAAEQIASDNRVVLVVDDNRDGADMLQMLIESEGFRVLTAYDGYEAVKTAQRVRPDVIVMDIGMPGMDGNQAAHLIRSQDGGENILIIALTGWGQDSAKQLTAESGFDHHLVKPVNFEELRHFLH